MNKKKIIKDDVLNLILKIRRFWPPPPPTSNASLGFWEDVVWELESIYSRIELHEEKKND
ncbi:MAG: hypothetical protein DRJ03_19740 [Chloroflexi bacterium]|nr:MAG: hypothetical protein DRJ03_19740 [Chloroflexota bacterium]